MRRLQRIAELQEDLRRDRERATRRAERHARAPKPTLARTAAAHEPTDEELDRLAAEKLRADREHDAAVRAAAWRQRP